MKGASFFRRLYIISFLFVLFLGATISIDWITLGGEEPVVEICAPAVELENGSLPPPFPPSGRRMFILLVDCLRYESAMDPAIMPYLNDLQNRSTYGYVKNSIDAVTAPSVRAAFTGKEKFSIFSVVSTFKAAYSIPSVFTQLNEVNVSISCYSTLAFKQFDNDIDDYYEVERVRWDWKKNAETESETTELAIRDYENGDHDVVILHLLEPHDIVHKVGPKSELLARSFGVADEVIERLDESIPPDENLLVMGDHGFADDGRHSYGLEVPTYFNIRGPGFKKDHEQRIAITDIRYFVSWGMGLPLPDNYDSGRYPTSLVSRGELPPEYAEEVLTLESGQKLETKVPDDLFPYFAVTVFHLAILGACWAVMMMGYESLEQIPAWKKVLAMASAVPLYVPYLNPLSSFLGVIVSAAALLLLISGRKETSGNDRRRAVLAMISLPGGILLVVFGYLLFYFRLSVPYKSMIPLVFWPVMMMVGLHITKRRGALFASWLALLIPLFLFYPTTYSYGWMAVMGPAILCFGLFHVWAAYLNRREGTNEGRNEKATGERDEKRNRGRNEGRNEKKNGENNENHDARVGDVPKKNEEGFSVHSILGPSEGYPFRKRIGQGKFLLLPVILVGILFFGERGVNFQFHHWYVIRLLPFYSLAAIAFAAKSILFLKAGHRIWSQAVTAAVIVLIFIIEIKILEPGKFIYLILIGMFLLSGVILHYSGSSFTKWNKSVPQKERTYLKNVSILAFLSLLYYYTIRIPGEYYLWADLLMAAVFFAGLFVKKYAEKSIRPSAHSYLLLLSVIIGGWMTLAWTLHNLEWFFLYDWVPEAILEKYILLFLPFLVLRFMIPVIMISFILKQFFREKISFSRKQVIFLGGLKLISLVFIFYGIGVNSSSNIFFEGIQEAVIFMILLFALLK